MKNTIFLILILFINVSVSISQTEKTYGEGVFIWSAYDLIENKIAGDGKGEVAATVTKIVKYIENNKPVAYHIHMVNKKSLEKSTYKLIKDPTAEIDVTFINLEDDNHVFLVKDMLDSNKYLELLSTKELPDVSNKYRMLIQVILN